MSSKLKLNMLKLVITTSPGGGWWVGGWWVLDFTKLMLRSTQVEVVVELGKSVKKVLRKCPGSIEEVACV